MRNSNTKIRNFKRENFFIVIAFFLFINFSFGQLTIPKKPSFQTSVYDYENILDAFQRGYNHEQVVTSRFYELADTANEEREHATISFLKWFIDEQVEEENTFNSLLKKVRRCEGNTAALYMLDEELSTRVFTPPTNA